MTEQNYPRTITLNNPELKNLIEEKSKLVNKGRAKSVEIEKLEAEMTEIEKNLIEEEKKVDLGEFRKKERLITKRMEKCIREIDEVKKAIYAKVKKGTPQELRDKYDEAKKQKEKMETERNKIALSAQKYSDKIIPLAREILKPSLRDRFEDYDSIRVENGEMKATIFSHLNDFEISFDAKRKE